MSRLSDATKAIVKWIFGLAMAGLGAYVLVAKIAVWPGIGLLTFGVFMLRPDELQAFAVWMKANVASYLKPPTP